MSIPPSDAQRETPPPGGARALHPEHRAYLQARGLADGTITAARMRSVTDASELSRLAGRPVPDGHSALVIPYGENFCRLRWFPPLPDGDGAEIRFLQPAGQPPRLYVPSAVLPILADASKALYITESEIKALALTQAGFPAVGLGGVWTFRTKDLPQYGLIADLEAIAWGGRRVYLVPDSDLFDNEHVKRATFRLATLLETRGATVRVVPLHAQPGGGKVGVDDFLVAKGRDELRRLLKQAYPLSHPFWKALRDGDRARNSKGRVPAPPPDLAGRRIHPALHLEADFASVGVLVYGPGGPEWRIITNGRSDYAAEDVSAALIRPPIEYPALGERWPAEGRTAFLAGTTSAASWAEAVRMAFKIFHDYIQLDDPCQYAVLACWTVATYVYPVFPVFPRLNLHGEKGTGKSKTLGLTAQLAHNGLFRVAPRVAPLFRLIEPLRPTLCLDEIEYLDGEDGGSLQDILKSGYRKGLAVDRCEGDKFTVKPYDVYAPAAFGGIKGLNAVLADRCITIIMRLGTDRARLNRDTDPETPDPRILAFRDLCYRLALTRWRDVPAAWHGLRLPAWLNGRSRELWGPLWAIADLAAAGDRALDLRPALRRLARPDAEERARLSDSAEAVLEAVQERLVGAETGEHNRRLQEANRRGCDIADVPPEPPKTTFRPGDLAETLKEKLGHPVSPTAIGLRLQSLGLKRDSGRKGGSRYTVTAADIEAIRARRAVSVDEPSPTPQEGDTGDTAQSDTRATA